MRLGVAASCSLQCKLLGQAWILDSTNGPTEACEIFFDSSSACTYRSKETAPRKPNAGAACRAIAALQTTSLTSQTTRKSELSINLRAL
jgi:hypothetical protein